MRPACSTVFSAIWVASPVNHVRSVRLDRRVLRTLVILAVIALAIGARFAFG
jgi:hypothetical protein